MKVSPLFTFIKTPLTLAAVVITAGLGASAANAQNFLAPTVGTGNIFESSQNTQNRAADNLFTGSPVVGSNTGNGAAVGGAGGNGLWDGYNNTTGAAFGANNDYAPILAFSLGTAANVTGVGYANNVIPGNAGKNKAGSINFYTLTLAQFNNYTASAPLITPFGTTGGTQGAGGLVAAPTAFLTSQTLTITDVADNNFTLYNLPTTVAGQYFVLQFNNSDPTASNTAGNFIGGEELRLVGTNVPEPSAWAAFGCIGLLGLVRRRQLAAWLVAARS